MIAAAQALRVVDEANLGLRWFLVVFGIIALLAAAIGAWLMAGRALRPIQQLAATTDAIGVTGDLSQRLPEVTHDDEVGALTESFNSMLRGIEQARAERDRTIASQQQFIADASHELRSPLTSIRANAGFLLDQPGAAAVDREAATEDIATEADRMGGLIDGLLTLARSDADGHAPPTDLVDLAHVLDVVERRARNLAIDLATDNDRPVLVRGDDNDLAELVWILVDNADRHGGKRARMSAHAEGDRGVMSVVDDGPGIDPADRDRVFDRFHRADSTRSGGGHGLGLSIAATIVERHGGTIVLADAADGGIRFTIELPLAP